MYLVTRSFYEGDLLHEAGQPFEHQDQAYIEKCLADGNISVAGEGETATPAPLEVTSVSLSDQKIPTTAEPIVAPQPPVQTVTIPVETQPQVQSQPTPQQIEQDMQLAEPSVSPIDLQIS